MRNTKFVMLCLWPWSHRHMMSETLSTWPHVSRSSRVPAPQADVCRPACARWPDPSRGPRWTSGGRWSRHLEQGVIWNYYNHHSSYSTNVVTEAWKYWDKHPPARISEHLSQVAALAQTEPVLSTNQISVLWVDRPIRCQYYLVWTSAEHRGSECL